LKIANWVPLLSGEGWERFPLKGELKVIYL
jgi:hypothetical protein